MNTDVAPAAAAAAPATAPATAPQIDYANAPDHVQTAAIAVPIDRRFVTAALMLVMVLAAMEMTITSTVMPTIIGELHGLEHYAWVASVYLLASTVTMPLYGRLADAWGRKRTVTAAILLFLAGSALAAAAQSMTQLILFRGLQGLGAGGIMPVVLTILGDIFTLKERARIQGFFSAVWGGAALAGPALGWFLVDHLGWRSVFYVNFPLGLAALGVLLWKYHDQEKPRSTDLDLPGAIALAAACTCMLALVSRLGPGGWSMGALLGLTIATIGTAGWFVRHARRTANPILSPSVLADRAIGPSLLGSLLLGVGILSLDVYVPLYVQGGQGGDAGSAAGVVTPVMLTWALSSMVAAPLVVRWGFRKTALLGTTLVMAGFAGVLACAINDWPRAALIASLALTGCGFGPTSMSYLLSAQDAVDWQRRGVVTGSVSFFRTIGGALGISLLGALFNVLVRSDLERITNRGVTPATLLDPHLRGAVPPDVLRGAQQAIAASLTWVFATMLLLTALQFVVTLWMPKKKCDHVVRGSEGMEAMGG